MFKNLVFVALVLLLVACGAPRPRHGVPQTPDESAWRAGLRYSGRIYHVDEAQSELRALVYRGGPLARFGHNHVMVNRSLRGAVNLADTAQASAFFFNLPVAGFLVDDAQARREEGADFAGEVPDDAKAATQVNMLATSLLDAAEFPLIAVNSVTVAGPQGAPGMGSMIATVSIKVAGHESKVDVPFALQSDSSRLIATGSLELHQSNLGLTPYSLMLGALQVQDAMTIKFKIVAVLR